MSKEKKQHDSKEKVIELKNIAVRYSERKSLFKSTTYTALEDISFDVYRGEVLGVIGRNGAGKSTLLRLLAGIIKPDSGKLVHHTKSVSLMALAAGFDPNLSGRQNSVISGMLMGYSRKAIQPKLEEIKKFSELQKFFEKPVKTYSSGMRARLAFSIAMYIAPDVLLIDEVLGVGDVSFKQKAEQSLEEKITSDITVIIVSHSEQQVSRLAERIVWIDAGKVRKEGPPEEVFPEYNINTLFSSFDLKIVKYKANKEFILHFENLEVRDDKLYFNCVLIDKKDRFLNDFQCMDDKGSLLTRMRGPAETPGFKKRYPDFKTSAKARYLNGVLLLNKRCSLKLHNIIVLEIMLSKFQ